MNPNTFIPLPSKLAIISPVFPPDDSGQAVMLGRIMRHFDPATYCLISTRSHPAVPYTSSGLLAQIPSLQGRFYALDTPPRKYWERLRPVREVINIAYLTIVQTLRLMRIVKREHVRAMIVCSGDLVAIPAAYLVSMVQRMPLYLYMFDHYRYQSVNRIDRFIAAWAERLATKRAKAVIVPNESLEEVFHQDYGVTPAIIHNPIDGSEIVTVDSKPWPLDLTGIKIVYTGQVYAAQYDALSRLVQAIKLLEQEYPLKLHLYTAQPRAVIEQAGIIGPVVFHGYCPPAQIRQIQQSADILFLPLAFVSPYPEIITTSAPSKFGEYLASGRPILAHVPPGFISRYMREHDCGYFVDQSSSELLVETIRSIVLNHERRLRVTRNAMQRAQIDFALNVNVGRFAALFTQRG
ncbi:MAG TPA: glycosyltransferase [Anaerolineales bacterium]|nr:glycosyltransferase [Anaerolineales bacterium]